jgi:hypothetical protein
VAAEPDVRHLVPGFFRVVSISADTPSPPAALIDLVGLLLSLLALVVAYKLTRPPPAVPVTDLPPAACDLQRETCRLELPGKQALELRIPDRPVRPNQAFVVEARSDGDAQFRPLALAIRGIEIKMDSATTNFEPDGSGGYRVRTYLPVCTVSKMTWEISVVLEADRQHLRWPLLITTESGTP